MKKTLIFTLLVIALASVIVVLTIVPRQDQPELETFIPENPQWYLPEGAKARIGKGTVIMMQYSLMAMF